MSAGEDKSEQNHVIDILQNPKRFKMQIYLLTFGKFWGLVIAASVYTDIESIKQDQSDQAHNNNANTHEEASFWGYDESVPRQVSIS